MLRFLASFLSFILLITYFKEYTVEFGKLIGLSGFWALYIPSTISALSILRLLDRENWGVLDALALGWLGIFALTSMTGNIEQVAYEVVKSAVGFAIGTILGAIAATSAARRG
ncbi:hypothetical protein A3L04_06450 [Thermococcus chitonophagus]|uniref:Hypothetical membrane protein, conserved n=1 Tax=Thermococcus chitonophagus TaxID=54262 RepID=A0A170SNB7_9EURY|nr:hypothetical protein [Thermococcus chitonophagus]ASJ16738.1 hypothetical protein A3L04_06450 [Thermococcus chitonophagus]CUX78204.1 hypothetical membrane protein, conserved [Thermococcus chitonophagus]